MGLGGESPIKVFYLSSASQSLTLNQGAKIASANCALVLLRPAVTLLPALRVFPPFTKSRCNLPLAQTLLPGRDCSV